MIPACDGQTVRQTVGQTESIIAKTALCIASYADALSKIAQTDPVAMVMNKKLSYRRETARPPHGGGLGPQPTLATPMHMVESETPNKLTSSVPSTKRTLR